MIKNSLTLFGLKTMKSINFEFLRPHRPELSSLGSFAENYSYSDPASALIKLRNFAEQMVAGIFADWSLPKPFNADLFDLINQITFKKAVPPVILDKLHLVRKQGNRAAHGEPCTTTTALGVLQETYDLARWLYITFHNGKATDCPPFTKPTGIPFTSESEELKNANKEILAALAAKEAEMKQLLDELEAARSKVQSSEKTEAQLQEMLSVGQGAANSLHFDEATTRKLLVDNLLTSAGWSVGLNGQPTEQVGQEVEILHQPTETGIGKADYVLWGDNDKPLAVIEAKKTSISPEIGRTQAKFYADGLEKIYGQRPVIFYTNGHEVFIWNDAQGEPPRQLYGFYSKDSLEYLLFQRHNRKPLEEVAPNPEIAGRMYQIEGIKQVTERFSERHRKVLVIQATGTGKTRVAVSLCDVLSRANWAKRILFLCDRKELRKQAHNVFKEYLPGEPRTFVTAITSKDRDKRIYLATYPAMMKCYETFDVGFFDLIIADESHRSIYNKYRDLFRYFDCLQVGLTATPVKFINRNTYRLFDCEDQNPTAHFSYLDAINHNPPFLSEFEVFETTTEFQRKGIKYAEMTREQQQQIEESEEDPESIDYEAEEIDRDIFNKDSNRSILRNLMENGIRETTGTRPGKSIIFARSHNHAILLQSLFDEMYPQYGGRFCQVIDNYDPRAEQLIDDFKGVGTNPDLTIAISVDMLDTGIDVPEVVNLVFAKPIKSYVKFWQMIGRGTRLCLNLFGTGNNKTKFRIFDHWGNFKFFGESYKEAEPKPVKSLLQRLFENRIRLVEAAIQKADLPAFELGIDLLAKDIAALPEKTIAVKEKWREIGTVKSVEILKNAFPNCRPILQNTITPLMQWRDTRDFEEAYEFDVLIANLQTELVNQSATFNDYQDQLREAVSKLLITINQVREKTTTINRIKSAAFWDNVTVLELEAIRLELRGIMKHKQPSTPFPQFPRIIDVAEDRAKFESHRHIPKLEGLELVAYRKRVEEVLMGLFNENPTLQKIKTGKPVSEVDLEVLCSLVLTQTPDVDLFILLDSYPRTAEYLEFAIRGIIGMNPEDVSARFEEFVHRHPELNSKQIRFLSLLKNHIAKCGSIELDRLYEAPFTTIDTNGIDGVFTDNAHINELLDILATFRPRHADLQVN